MQSILLVEDDPFLVDIYKRKLKDFGFDVVVSKNGLDALRKLEKRKFDVVLLDIVLPDLDGWDVLAKIRNNPRLKSMKVVILSNLGQQDDVKRASELGVSRYLIKAHYTPSEVAKIIKDTLEKRL